MAPATAVATAAAPPRIQKLDPVVVNRIAAGEVVHRPASAIKELLENSIDAGSTSITVLAKAGGLKSFQVQDNGHGIQHSDLQIVCKRFTTSKLSSFEDLQSIQTYGFRGEALASISHVARVSITTKTQDQPCAYKASYADGTPTGAPRPCAGVRGTTIIVDDLFHNVPTRLRALQSASEEYNRILDVTSKYAIHCGTGGHHTDAKVKALAAKSSASSASAGVVSAAVSPGGVSFSCRKLGSSSADVHTTAKGSIKDNIRTVFGSALANELLELRHESPAPVSSTAATSAAPSPVLDSKLPRFRVHGWMTNANFSRRKSEFIFFINHRLVSCGTIKRALEAIYSEYLPKSAYPFVYISLELPAENCDVNVSPTKREVHFLDEEVIVAAVQTEVRLLLQGANYSRVFHSQAILVADPIVSAAAMDAEGSSSSARGTTQRGASTIDESNEYDSDFEVPTKTRQTIDTSEQTRVMGAIRPVRDTSDVTTTPTRRRGGGNNNGPANASSSKRKVVSANRFVRTDSKSVQLDTFFTKDNASGGVAVTQQNGDVLTAMNADQNAKRTRATQNNDTNNNTISDKEEAHGCCGGGSHSSHKQHEHPVVNIDADEMELLDANGNPVQFSHDNNDEEMLPDSVPEALLLASVKELREEFISRAHQGLTRMLKNHVFVGLIDDTFSLVQVGTRLYTIDHSELTRETMFQQVLLRFGLMPHITLNPPLLIWELIAAGLRVVARGEGDSSAQTNYSSEQNIALETKAKRMTQTLVDMAEMLDEYFSIRISVNKDDPNVDTALLSGMPEVLNGHLPQMEALPIFLVRLVREVDWTDEKACFRCIAWEIAEMYAQIPLMSMGAEDDAEQLPKTPRRTNSGAKEMSAQERLQLTQDSESPQLVRVLDLSQESGATKKSGESADKSEEREEGGRNSPMSTAASALVKNVLFPAFRSTLRPPPEFAEPANAVFVQVAMLDNLYKIFERC